MSKVVSERAGDVQIKDVQGDKVFVFLKPSDSTFVFSKVPADVLKTVQGMIKAGAGFNALRFLQKKVGKGVRSESEVTSLVDKLLEGVDLDDEKKKKLKKKKDDEENDDEDEDDVDEMSNVEIEIYGGAGSSAVKIRMKKKKTEALAEGLGLTFEQAEEIMAETGDFDSFFSKLKKANPKMTEKQARAFFNNAKSKVKEDGDGETADDPDNADETGQGQNLNPPKGKTKKKSPFDKGTTKARKKADDDDEKKDKTESLMKEVDRVLGSSGIKYEVTESFVTFVDPVDAEKASNLLREKISTEIKIDTKSTNVFQVHIVTPDTISAVDDILSGGTEFLESLSPSK